MIVMLFRFIKKIIVSIILSATLFYLSASPISQGMDWLRSMQQPDGYWQEVESPGTEFISTFSVLQTFQSLGIQDSSYIRGLKWLKNQNLGNSINISQMLILQPALKDTLLDSLLSCEDSIGGFSLNPFYLRDILSTSWTLNAFWKCGYSEPVRFQNAVSFVLSERSDSGYWRYEGEVKRTLYLTAFISDVFTQFKFISELDSTLQSSFSYIVTRQNPNGSFGEGTIYETAFSLLALLDSERNFTAQTNKATQFLISEQDTNGSWNGSPYETAVAIWALSKIKANLVVSNIFADTLYPIEGDTVNLFAVVKNIGAGATGMEILKQVQNDRGGWGEGILRAESICVRFYDGIPDSQKIIGEVFIPDLEPFQEDTVSVKFATQGESGLHSIFAVADPENEIIELNEQDNQNSFMLRVIGGYDLEIAAISFSPEYPAPDRPFTITAEVYNWSGVYLDYIPVRFYRGHPDSGGIIIGDYIIPGLAPLGQAIASVQDSLPEGNYRIFAFVDPENTIQEIDEANNLTQRDLTVTSQKDLAVYSWSISFSIHFPEEDDTVRVGASIYNLREATAEDFSVRFCDGHPDTGEVLGEIFIDSLCGFGDTTVFIDWSLLYKGGLHYVYVFVDPESLVNETDETNNLAYTKLEIKPLPDLTFNPDSILTRRASPPYDWGNPYDGDSVWLSIWLKNIGNAPIPGQPGQRIWIDFYNGDPDQGGLFIDRKYTGVPYPGSPANWICVLWHTLGCEGENDIYVAIDVLDSLDEILETNNIGHKIIQVLPGQKSDLAIFPEDIEFLPSAHVWEGDTVLIQATVHNLQNKPEDSVCVAFYLEDPDYGGVLIGEEILLHINGLAQASVSETLFTAGLLGEQEIFVVVDPENLIEEKNENNNKTSNKVRVDIPAVSGPTNLQVIKIDSTTAQISWSPPAGYTPKGYRLYRNDVLANPPVNIAGQGVASASSSANYYVGPDKAIDGKLHTYWQSSYTTEFPIWWQDSLPDEREIYVIAVKFDSSMYTPSFYNLEAWINSDWVIVDSIRDNTRATIVHYFKPFLQTSKFRVVVDSNPIQPTTYRLKIYEVLAYSPNLISDTIYTDSLLGRREWSYFAKAANEYLAESPASNRDSLILGDFVPPSVPTNITYTVYPYHEIYRVNLYWNKNPETDLAGYRLYLNGEPIARMIDTIPAQNFYSNPEGTYYKSFEPFERCFYFAWRQIWITQYKFTRFDTEKNHDILRIYDRKTEKLVDVFSGDIGTFETGPLMVSARRSSNRFFFESDWSGVREGWEMSEGYIPRPHSVTNYYHVYLYEQGHHRIQISAVDYMNNESDFAEVYIDVIDTIPPETPVLLCADPGNKQVELTWTKNKELDFKTYNLYRNDSLILLDTTLTDTFFVDTGLVNLEVYTYCVTAVDFSGNESEPSNELGTIPSAIDLAIFSENIYFMPRYPREGTNILTTVKVWNLGTDPADSTLVSFYDGHPDSGGVLLGEKTVSIPPDENRTTTLKWQGAAGTHSIWIAASVNGYPDYNPENNIANKILHIYDEDAKIVMFDDGHYAVFTVDTTHITYYFDPKARGAYGLFAEELRDAGFQVVTLAPQEKLTSFTLEGIDALIINSPSLDPWDIKQPYEDAEVEAVVNFVKDGGGLFLITDHSWYEIKLYNLSKAFGIGWEGYNLHKGTSPAQAHPSDNFIGFFDSTHIKQHSVTQDVERIFVNWTNVIFPMPKKAVSVVLTDSAMLPDNMPTMALIYEDPVNANSVTGKGRIFIASDPNSFDNMGVDPYVADTNYRIYKGDNEILVVNVVKWLTEDKNWNLPDLAISSLNISPMQAPPIKGSEISVAIHVANYGDVDITEVPVSVYAEQPSGDTIKIGYGIIPEIPVNMSDSLKFIFRPLFSGTYHIFSLVDPENVYNELNENNNHSSVSFEIFEPTLPNLSVSQIRLAPEPVREGEVVDIRTTVFNYGTDIDEYVISFYLGEPPAGRLLKDTLIVIESFGFMDSATIEIAWSSGGYEGAEEIWAFVDPLDLIIESNEEDNKSSAAIDFYPTVLDISVSTDKVVYSSYEDIEIGTVTENTRLHYWQGIGVVTIEDSLQNVVATVDSFDISLNYPYRDWHYRIPITVAAGHRYTKDGMVNLAIDFGHLLDTLQVIGSFDTNSIRILEFTRTGVLINEKLYRYYPKDDSSEGIVTFQVDDMTLPDEPRYFALYFDIVENGPKEPASAFLPFDGIGIVNVKNEVFVLSPQDSMTVDSLWLGEIPFVYSSYPPDLVLGDFDRDFENEAVAGIGSSYICKLYYLSDFSLIEKNRETASSHDASSKDILKQKTINTPLELYMNLTDDDYSQRTSIYSDQYLEESKKIRADSAWQKIAKFWGIRPSPAGGRDTKNMSTADFNSDGLLDIIIETGGFVLGSFYLPYYDLYQGYLFLFLNNGDGTFERIELEHPKGRITYTIETADFDNDGNADFLALVADRFYAPDVEIHAFLGNGDGTFKDPLKTDVYRPDFISAGDFDSDKNVDLVLVGSSPRNVWFLKGRGDGTFESAVPINLNPPYTTNHKEAYSYDLNHDGKADLLIPEYSYVMPTGIFDFYLYTGNGDATFNEGTKIFTVKSLYGYPFGVGMPSWKALLDATLGKPETVISRMENSFIWNTTNTLAGQYNVRLDLEENSAVVISAGTSIEILPDSQIVAGVSVDKIEYYANENVCISAEVENTSANNLYENLNIEIHIIDTTGFEFAQIQDSIAILLPGDRIERDYVWNTGQNHPGTYFSLLYVHDSIGNILAADTSEFRIKESSGGNVQLIGSIMAIPDTVQQGENFDVHCSVENVGNVGVENMILNSYLVEPETQIPYLLNSEMISLPIDSTYTSMFTASSSPFEPDTYMLTLIAEIDTSTIGIASSYLIIRSGVIDTMPPVITIEIGEPKYGEEPIYLRKFTEIEIAVIDSGCGVDSARYKVAPGAWNYFIDSVQFDLQEYEEGLHDFLTYARDLLGNEIEIAKILAIDETPSHTDLTIGEPSYPLPGDSVLITSQTPLDLLAYDIVSNNVASGIDHLAYRFDEWTIVPDSVASLRLTGEDGGYRLDYYAEDHVENQEEMKSQNLVLDNTLPEAMIISPLDSTLVNKTIKIIGTATDPHFALYQVSYGIGWNPQNWILIKESDIPVIEDVLAEWHTDLLDDGRYTIRLLVKDLVNNEKEDRVLLIVGEPQYSFEITGFNKCEGVAVDEAGYIYVADRNSNPIPQHNRIAKFDPYGHLILNIFDVRKPNGVDVDDSGNIYASEWAGDCVTKFSPAGDSLMTIIGFNKPKGVAVDRLYQIYVADRNNNRVVRCDPQGNFNLVIENLGHPKGVDADNLKIYSTDTNTGKIKIFDQGGNPLFEFGEGLNQPSDVEVDSRGYIWVVDRNNNRILCYDFFGNRLLDFGTIGSGPGEFNKPEGVAVSEIADGVVKEVFVADRNNDRVCKFIIPYLISYQAGIMGPSLGSPELEITEAVAYPSPYDPNKGLCRIRAILTTEADAKLTIYTLSGRVVYRDEIFSGLGIVEFVWDGRNEIGEMVNNGVYGFLIQARNETESKEKEGKFIVLKH